MCSISLAYLTLEYDVELRIKGFYVMRMSTAPDTFKSFFARRTIDIVSLQIGTEMGFDRYQKSVYNLCEFRTFCGLSSCIITGQCSKGLEKW